MHIIRIVRDILEITEIDMQGFFVCTLSNWAKYIMSKYQYKNMLKYHGVFLQFFIGKIFFVYCWNNI